MVAAASDLGACVCEDDATVTELDDLLARVAELEAERDALAKRVDEVAWTHHADDYVAHRFNQEWDRAEAAEARVRVQAEQIAALQEAPEPTVAEWLDALDARFKAEETEDWRTPSKRTTREYAARQARIAVEELRFKITEFDEAIAFAEGCAAPADEEEK